MIPKNLLHPFLPTMFQDKHLNIWLGSYIKELFNQCKYQKAGMPLHIFFSIVDHFEPYRGNVSKEIARKRVDKWYSKYPIIADKYIDSDGNHPKHTFFYPEEEYDFEIMNSLSDLCKKGYGDVEIHLHHDNDTAEGLKDKLNRFKRLLYDKHKLLRKDENSGEIIYGFIHGNWALDNSRLDGRWCGVNNELTVLKETGCYADFTLPSAPSDTQTRKINSIYYAKDDLLRPKSHDTGIDVESGKLSEGDIMLIQGPLTLNWKNRKFGIFPGIENGEIAYDNRPSNDRIDLWIKQHIHVKGKPEWIFVKVHTHGLVDQNIDFLLNGGLDLLYGFLGNKYNDMKNYFLHYVSAWEMYNVIKKAELLKI